VLHIVVRGLLCPWHCMWTQFLFLIVCIHCIPSVVFALWTQILFLKSVCVAYSCSWPLVSVALYVDTVFILDSLCPLHTAVLLASWVVCGHC